MTPKEKAEELVDKYRFILIKSNTDAGEEILCTLLAKECALVAVDEILNHHSQEQGLYRIDTYYWQQVKKEIEKL
jgi:predicted DNA-binding protein (UPF0278 family)